MPAEREWPIAEAIDTARLTLEPLRPDHAAELAPLLDDTGLHRYIDGRPATLAELRARFTRQSAGRSPDGQQGWLNWIVRHRATAAAVGTVQATLAYHSGRLSADVAWVIATAHQRHGYAREAAAGMAGWLHRHGTQALTAHIHPDHQASARVAEHLGLTPTTTVVDGEIRWFTDRSG